MLLVGGPIKAVPTMVKDLKSGDRISLNLYSPHGIGATIKTMLLHHGNQAMLWVEEFDLPFTLHRDLILTVWVDDEDAEVPIPWYTTEPPIVTNASTTDDEVWL